MTYPLVGLLGIALPLLLGFAPVQVHSEHSGFVRRVDTIDEASPLSAKDKSGKLSPVFVKLTHVETDPEHMGLAATLDEASRTAITAIPGVTVLGDNDDEAVMAKKSRKPVVVLSPRLQNIATTKDGDEVEFKAKAQYIIYRMPSRDIAAVVDGAARTRLPAKHVRSKASRQEVENGVAAAAIESAAKRAPAALIAIAKR
jgi:hypothetical protein